MTAETDTQEHGEGVGAHDVESASAELAATPEELSELVEAADADASGASSDLDLGDRIKQLEDEKIRIAADFANYQKRVNRDRANWSHEAVRDLVGSMLTVLDNLELSIAAFEGEVKDAGVYRQGVELVQTELLRVLGNSDLQRIDASEGTPFDPDLHQAISVTPVDGIEQEEVAIVARSGYRLGDVVLRPAQVVVRKPS